MRLKVLLFRGKADSFQRNSFVWECLISDGGCFPSYSSILQLGLNGLNNSKEILCLKQTKAYYSISNLEFVFKGIAIF